MTARVAVLVMGVAVGSVVFGQIRDSVADSGAVALQMVIEQDEILEGGLITGMLNIHNVGPNKITIYGGLDECDEGWAYEIVQKGEQRLLRFNIGFTLPAPIFLESGAQIVKPILLMSDRHGRIFKEEGLVELRVDTELVYSEGSGGLKRQNVRSNFVEFRVLPRGEGYEAFVDGFRSPRYRALSGGIAIDSVGAETMRDYADAASTLLVYNYEAYIVTSYLKWRGGNWIGRKSGRVTEQQIDDIVDTGMDIAERNGAGAWLWQALRREYGLAKIARRAGSGSDSALPEAVFGTLLLTN